MYLDFSIQNQPVYPIQAGVEAIYHINADQNYHTQHKEIRPQKYFLCITTNGEGEFISDDVCISAQESSFVLLQPQYSFSYRCSGDKWQFWWVEFYLSEPVLEISKVHTITSLGRVNLLLEHGLLMAKKGEWKGAAGLISALIYTLCCSTENYQRNSGIPAAAEEYIRENLNTVTVAQLCIHLDVSDRTLRNLFHRSFDMSPKRFILKCRMDLAQQLLEDTSFSVGEVAARLGFANPFHFSGSFKAYFGISPTEYRKSAISASR